MGIHPTEIVYGNNCNRCYGPGLTPKEFKVFVSGIKRGNDWNPGDLEPPNGYHDIVQDVGDNCNWQNAPGLDPLMGMTFNALGSHFSIISFGVLDVFNASVAGQCVKHFTNDFQNPVGAHYYGGFVSCSTVKALSDIVESITPMIDPDPRLECWSMEDELIVVRYAGKRDATKIYIKVDTNP